MTRLQERRDVTSETPLREIVAANLRAAQASKGLTNDQLARETGISLRLVQKHRAGHNSPGHANLRRYAAVLDKPVDFFFRRPKAAA